MKTGPISAPQIAALQVAWGHLCQLQDLGRPADTREARLAWVGGVVGRQLGSFKDLTRAEANTAIERMNACLPEQLRIPKRHRRPDARQAYRYGTAGRRGHRSREIQLVDEQTWQILHGLMHQLGWTLERLDAFVRSKHGPGRIDTLAQANRVIWSMRNMLRRKARLATETQSHREVPQEATPF